jgi:hypothetical protein
MLLPNGAYAVVDIRKLRDYCLNPDNPRGSNKARVFAAALGLTAADAATLQRALLNAALHHEATLGELDAYGQRYTLDFEMITAIASATVRSGWIVLHTENVPRLTTCYVTRKGG